jgi:hypothetical protein
MDTEHILRTLNDHSVDYVVVAGSLSPAPSRCDLSILIDDTPANRIELNFALKDLFCECADEAEKLKPVPDIPVWLEEENVHVLKSPYGELCVFRALDGLAGGFEEAKGTALLKAMQDGEMYYEMSAG